MPAAADEELRVARAGLSSSKLLILWSGRGDLNARPPAPKGESWFPKTPSAVSRS
jgi:hypothetical protein